MPLPILNRFGATGSRSTALVREGSIPVAEKIVREPADVARLMTPLIADLDREAFWVLLLDGKNKIIGINLVALGSLTACLVHPRLCCAKHKRGYVAAPFM